MSPDSPSRVRWDVDQYDCFKRERSRPFHDLLARIPEGPVERAADLGCGDGELTRVLLERWPKAEVWGVDSSEEMLARALASPVPRNLHFVQQDLRDWRPSLPLDLVVSNAALHWVPDHGRVLRSLTELLGPAGVLAVQVPNNRGEAAYQMLDELRAEPSWAERLRQVPPGPLVESAGFYERCLLDLGFDVQMWETIYYHRLAVPSQIVEWLKGTALRPLLSTLSEAEGSEFLGALSARIESAYVADRDGIVFPFRRLFFVARRPDGRG